MSWDEQSPDELTRLRAENARLKQEIAWKHAELTVLYAFVNGGLKGVIRLVSCLNAQFADAQRDDEAHIPEHSELSQPFEEFLGELGRLLDDGEDIDATP